MGGFDGRLKRMATTPKAERRNRIIRQSLHQEENKNVQLKLNQTKFQQQSNNNLESFDKYTKQSNKDVVLANTQEKNNINLNNTFQSTIYQQICLPQDYISNNYEFRGGGGWEEQLPPSFGNKNENASKRFPLLYRVQMLKGFEVLCKRLLFHLVKASASSPKCFVALPFALIGASLLLCSFSSSWPSSLFKMENVLVVNHFFNQLIAILDKNLLLFLTRVIIIIFQMKSIFQKHKNKPEKTQKINCKKYKKYIYRSKGHLLLSTNETLFSAYVQLFGLIQDATIQHHKQIYKWWDLCQKCHLDKNLANWFKSNLDSQNSFKIVANTENLNYSYEKIKENFLDGIYGDEELNTKKVHFNAFTH
ncbi:hypothetical protein Mgra_00002549 [Meloidogyne graminicola]|uniref:Transmembrane protein n=1 Tax=Meloidogyne graminicola TaxID=189291 RepID=A0A8S9ZXS5_9BILA|nr:hypothetical protein Mgra_00002549 [Meloidogyne graminicola]